MTERSTPKVFEVAKVGRTYQDFLSARSREVLGKPELSDVRQWVERSVAALPEMAVTETPLTGKGGWRHEMTPKGEVRKVSGSFFDIPGQEIKITKPDGTSIGWNQPGIIQTESPISLPTPEGYMTFPASGFVGVLDNGKDGEDRRILLTVGQEPFAQTEKKALVRTPFQTSAAKLDALLKGDSEKDKNLSNLLSKIGNGKTPQELFASGDIRTFPLAPADPNRIQATNIGFSMTVTDERVQVDLENNGANRWCSLDEIRALVNAGIVNGHTTAALFAL